MASKSEAKKTAVVKATGEVKADKEVKPKDENKVTGVDISDALAAEQGLSKKAAASAVKFVFQHIKGSIVEGKSVAIPSFGSFSVRERKGGKSGLPGKPSVAYGPSKNMGFTASSVIKKAMNEK